jgi:transcriptional regulator with XRE-family HTH domain
MGDAPKSGRTRAGDMLSRCPDSHAEIAAKIGRDKSLVTRWISGARAPSARDAAKLAELYAIPVEAWHEPPAPAPKGKTKAKASATPPAAPPSPPPATSRRGRREEDEYGDEDRSNVDRLHGYIREGMRELELDVELSGVKRAEALKKLVDAQVALDKSTGDNALTMARIAAHPEFLRVVRTITEAIAPHPEVLSKVLAALESSP